MHSVSILSVSILTVCRPLVQRRIQMLTVKDINKQVGLRARQLREQAGLSQEDLAARCQLHRTYIGLVERGERNLSLTALQTIADGLSVPIGALFEPGQSEMDKSPPKRIRNAVSNHRRETQVVNARLTLITEVLVESGLIDQANYEERLRRLLSER